MKPAWRDWLKMEYKLPIFKIKEKIASKNEHFVFIEI